MAQLATNTGNRATPVSKRGAQLHETPPEAIRALLALEYLPHLIWEPCCGRGAIVRELEKKGHKVIASDLHDYGWDHQRNKDFLKTKKAPVTDITIVTNPPFGLELNKFIKQALHLSPKIFFLLRIQGLTSCGRQNFINNHLSRVYTFSRRLPMMHRDGWAGNKATSAMDFAWFIFERGHKNPAQIQAIDWKDFEMHKPSKEKS